jgi:FeS assembly SUF system regulator
MAKRNNQMVSATLLAEATKLPEPTVSKILKSLAKHGVVASMRGANGGYVLERSIGDISMADVITALDGPIALTSCVEESATCCDRADHCAIKGKWNPVNQAMQQALENVSLKQMMGEHA